MSQAVPPVDAASPVVPGRGMERLPSRTIALFACPMLGLGFMFILMGLYLPKFSTDVLGIAPGAIGVILLCSRIWDGISDPVAGYLSDRTRSRWGRRRPWLVLGALPLACLYVALWNPPAALSASASVAWVAAAMLLFLTCSTVVNMPYDSLGAELSPRYEDRNRLFGAKRAALGFGSILAFLSIGLLSGSEEPRSDAFFVTCAAGALAASLLIVAGAGLRERSDFQGRGARSPWTGLADVWRNPHARRLLLVFALLQMGVASIAASAAYYTDYILGRPELTPWVLAAFFLSSIAAIPVWVALGRHRDKRSLVIVGLVAIGAATSCLAFAHQVSLVAVFCGVAVAGVGSGGLDVLFPSIQADVIDWDELETGERKEGMYFAAWNLAQKSALGLGAAMVGITLELSGFEPNVAQSDTSRAAITGLVSVAPAVCFVAGLLAFLPFRLGREAHAGIRAALDARRQP